MIHNTGTQRGRGAKEQKSLPSAPTATAKSLQRDFGRLALREQIRPELEMINDK